MALTNTQHDAIMRNYQFIQTRHRHEQNDRIEEAFARFPRLAEIDAEIASKSVACGRKLLSGDQNALLLLKSEIRHLAQERKYILINGGYPENYLELYYTCPDCKDTGYIENEKCHCFKKAAIDLLYTQSNLADLLEKECFHELSFDYYDPNLMDPSGKVSALAAFQKAVDASRKFVAEFDTSFENLFFFGETGLGKTFLSHCIAKELLDSAHSVIYFSAQELFDNLAEERFHKGTTDSDTCSLITECDLLIIDDLGTEMTNAFVVSELFSCINERLANQKSTIISTNLTPDKITDRYSERIFSRIATNYQLYKFFGKDIRLQKKLRQMQ